MDPELMTQSLEKTIELPLAATRLLHRLRAVLHRPGFLLSRPSRRLVAYLLEELRHGSLRVVLPDGAELCRAGSLPGPDATIVLHHPQALWRLLCAGDLGLAEAYIAGEWSTPDLIALLELGGLNMTAWDGRLAGTWVAGVAARLGHLSSANTRRGSRRNIVAHYDLGNDFYAAWLDAGMSYSSAFYAGEALSLEEAQDRKQDRILEMLELAPGMGVLEIGCGWGGLMARLMRAGAGAVTGLTLSDAQAEYAGERLAGLPAAEVRLQDYRDVDGLFDRIVSIEMFEAVGAAWWPVFFAVLAARLAPGGVAVMQIITIAEDRYDRYRSKPDFIQAHIFPGGMLPTRTILAEQVAGASLRLDGDVVFGSSYAETLAVWAQRFDVAWPVLRRQGFDESFRRKWRYYLAYCEAGFRTGLLDVGLYRIRHVQAADEPGACVGI